MLKQKNSDFYRNYIKSHYKEINKNFNFSVQKRFYFWKSFLFPKINKNKKIKVLEIGCGMGHNLISLSKEGYSNLVGVDFSKECVEFCKKRELNVYHVINDSFYEKNKSKFDLVIIYDVLEHCSPIEAVSLLNNANSSLKKGGKVLISLPNPVYPLNGNILYGDVTHKFFFNETSILQLLKNSNFKIESFFYLNSFSTFDENILKKFFKLIIMIPFAFISEFFWKLLAFGQGVILKKCRPTIICLAEK